eukprot:scaffold95155_cov17-Tisochrysis_lutea.AAC.1
MDTPIETEAFISKQDKHSLPVESGSEDISAMRVHVPESALSCMTPTCCQGPRKRSVMHDSHLPPRCFAMITYIAMDAQVPGRALMCVTATRRLPPTVELEAPSSTSDRSTQSSADTTSRTNTSS